MGTQIRRHDFAEVGCEREVLRNAPVISQKQQTLVGDEWTGNRKTWGFFLAVSEIGYG